MKNQRCPPRHDRFDVVGGLAGVVLEALRPIAGPIYMLYGVFLPFWFFFVGRRLFKLSRSEVSGA